MKITNVIRKNGNKALTKLIKKNGSCYFDYIPVGEINEALKPTNLALVNEDGTPLSAMFCGNHSKAEINISFNGQLVENSYLILMWYKMDSGRYEITMYIS